MLLTTKFYNYLGCFFNKYIIEFANYIFIGGDFVREKHKSDFLLNTAEVSVDIGKRELREHRHSRFEIVHFRKGQGIYTVNGKNFSIKPDDVFVFSSNEQHCITDVSESLEFVNLHFEPRFFWGSRFESF